MKNIILIFSLLVLSQHSIGQIQFEAFGEVFADDVMFSEDIGRLELLENVKDTTKQAIMLGFRKTDIELIKPYLSPKLKDEADIIDSLFSYYEDKYNLVDSIYLFENSGYAFGQTGTIAITKFSQKQIGVLAIEYQYYCPGKQTIINQISLNGKEFPTELIQIRELQSKTGNKELSNNEKFDIYMSLLKLISPKEGTDFNEFFLPQSSNELSYLNGNLSWYALNIGENAIAVEAAIKGLKFNPSNKWINTNLALGLAQVGRLDEALKIYTELKSVHYRDTVFKEIFLADIEEVEANGVKIKHKKKIIKVLTNE